MGRFQAWKLRCWGVNPLLGENPSFSFQEQVHGAWVVFEVRVVLVGVPWSSFVGNISCFILLITLQRRNEVARHKARCVLACMMGSKLNSRGDIKELVCPRAIVTHRDSGVRSRYLV